MPTDHYLAEIEQKIADLEATRAGLDAAISEWKITRKRLSELVKASEKSTYAKPDTKPQEPAAEKLDVRADADIGPLDFSDGSLNIPEATKAVLAHFGKPMKAREIAAELLRARLPTAAEDEVALRDNVSGTVNRRIRLYNDPDLVKVGTAFGLRSWQNGTRNDELPLD